MTNCNIDGEIGTQMTNECDLQALVVTFGQMVMYRPIASTDRNHVLCFCINIGTKVYLLPYYLQDGFLE